MMSKETYHQIDLPELPLASWRETKDTLHLFTQIMGKIRLRSFPAKNHWWHVTLYLYPRGLTTGAIPYGYGSFQISLDMAAHQVLVEASSGGSISFPLYDGLSVARFYECLFEALRHLGIEVSILAVPYDRPTTTPFMDDHDHHSYDGGSVEKFRTILTAVGGVMETFRGQFVGKSTPVHFFWHSFDLVVTRFSGNEAPDEMVSAMGLVDREAYSHEVVSVGFWPGDDNVPAPAFYAYAYPEPDGIREEELRPEAARWETVRGGAMALLMYDDIRTDSNPGARILDFLNSSYSAGARRMGWDSEGLEYSL